MRRFVLSIAVAFSLLTSSATAAPINLVANGDFSLGNVDFVTDYLYSPSTGWPAGVYSIEAQGNPWNGYFVPTGDHTSGSGNMLVVNGIDAGVPNTVWQTTVSGLTQQTDYYFEAYLMNLCCTVLTLRGPELSFYANDLRVGIGNTDTSGVWTSVSTIWNSGGSDSVTLALRNDIALYDGNDFAADDIYFGAESKLGLESQAAVAAEPASLVLLGTGGLLAAVRRRRARRQPAAGAAAMSLKSEQVTKAHRPTPLIGDNIF